MKILKKRLIVLILVLSLFILAVSVLAANTTTNKTVSNVTSNKTGNLNVTSNPSGANVYVDGISTAATFRGLTPIFISGLTVGKHSVLLTKEGFKDYKKTVSISAGKTTKLNVKLVKVVEPVNATNITKCGDGKVNQVSEQCDGRDLGGKSCISFGFTSGRLACNSRDCTFNTNGCKSAPSNLTNTTKAPTTKCKESDRGSNIFINGTTCVGTVCYSDYCLSNSTLLEYYCKGKEISKKEHKCPRECKVNACVK